MDIINVNNNYSFLQNFVKRIKVIQIISVVICGTLGLLFYYFTSCCSDEMIINLNPFVTVLYSMILGAYISMRR